MGAKAPLLWIRPSDVAFFWNLPSFLIPHFRFRFSTLQISHMQRALSFLLERDYINLA